MKQRRGQRLKPGSHGLWRERFEARNQPMMDPYCRSATPWAERRARILEWVAKEVGVYAAAPARHRGMSPIERQRKRDIERLIAEGVIERYRSICYSSNRRGGWKRTGVGRTRLRLVNPLPEPEVPEKREPYAKRKAGMAEFMEANR